MTGGDNETFAHDVAADHALECRRWFGGWSLLRQGRQVAIVMDTLYVRVDDALRAELDSTGQSQPFRYRRADGREIEVDAYRAVPSPVLNDPPALQALMARAAPHTPKTARVRRYSPRRVLE